MSNTQIEDRAREFIDALHTLEKGGIDDADKITALFASDATLANAALDNKGRELKGTDEILQFWVQYKETLGQVDTRFHHVMVSGWSIGLFWTTSGKNPEGEDVNYHGSTLLQFNSEGKIEFFRGYYDTRELALKSRA
jgi:hypothetical protein